MICQACGKTIENPTRADQKYCSDVCGRIFRRFKNSNDQKIAISLEVRLD